MRMPPAHVSTGPFLPILSRGIAKWLALRCDGIDVASSCKAAYRDSRFRRACLKRLLAVWPAKFAGNSLLRNFCGWEKQSRHRSTRSGLGRNDVRSERERATSYELRATPIDFEVASAVNSDTIGWPYVHRARFIPA